MKKARKIAAAALELSKADETEVVVSGGASALTRFAGNRIHQNVGDENLTVTVRAAARKRVGVASSNDTSRAGLKKLVAKALEIAQSQGEDPDFPGLPGRSPLAEAEAYSNETARITPAQRAAMAKEIIRPAAAARAAASGAVSNTNRVMGVANSRGVSAFSRTTRFEASAVVESDTSAGYAAGVSWTKRRVNVAETGRTALKKCVESTRPQQIEPGEYTVVLEPQAVAGLLSYTAYMGFGAQSFLEERSFMWGRIGEKLMHESVSIWDDGLDEEGLVTTFDYEGVPKQRVNLIEKGVARGVVYDTYHAAKAPAASTGHAMPAGFAGGPLTTNIIMAGGKSSLREMIASTARGILVTRFHYVNIADGRRAVLTGLTRDGTFLIENGEIAHPVKNMRFTESMLRAFSAVEALSAKRSLEPALAAPALVPAAKLSAFRFTGAAD